MKKASYLSRRQLVAALTIPSMAGWESQAIEAWSPDAELIKLGRQFDEVTAQIDAAISDPTTDIADEILDRLGRIEAKILNTQSLTVDGLRVKARATCWALLGDLDPTGEPTPDKRMSLSIVRDLIRLYDSNLECPGALKKLVAEIENGASRSSP
jgi:hypothetical protein